MSQVLSPWGYLPDGWNLSTIDEEKTALFDYVANGSFASLAENVKYRETPDYAVLIRLVDYNNNFSGDFVYIDEHAYNFLSKSKLYGDEIIISNVGANVGTVFKAPRLNKKMSLAPNAICVKFKGCNDFYYYWLRSRIGQHIINSLVSGSAQPKFNKTHFRSMPIPVPPIEIQENIASILSSLDDKIAVNRRICENLEAQAQALFKHWFIDFTPFKDGKFIESELGMIPEGWRVGTLGDIAEFKRGKTITKSETKDGTIPVVAGGLEPAYYHSQSNTLSRVITISSSGANAGFTRMYYQPVWASDCSFVDNSTTSYLHTAYCYLKTYKKRVDALQWGAAQPHVYAKDINKLPFVIAPLQILSQFEALITELFDCIEINDKENLCLSTLRDTLLPKLMSGQIKVNETEKSL